MSRPDVALISPYPDASGRQSLTSGVATYTRNLACALADTGLEVVVVAPQRFDEPATEVDGRVTVERCFRPGRGALPAAYRAAVATGAVVVHLQHELFLYGGLAALPGMFMALGRSPAKNSRVATVLTMHQVVDPVTIDRAFVKLHRMRVPATLARAGLASLHWAIQRQVDAVIVHEESFKRVTPGAVVVPHGVEPARSISQDDARTRLALDERFTVLCFGFVAPYKGLELACEAAELAERRGKRIHLVIAGGDHPRFAGRHPYLDALRARFGGSVTFTGYVPESEVSPWFTAAELALFLYPKPHATSGALALALAHGTPVLVSEALADLIGAPRALVASGNANELATQLVQLATSAPRYEELRTRSAGLNADRSWQTIARRHLKIYEEVLDANRAAGRSLRTAQSRR